MADQLQLRGGTTTEHATFTGALREVTVDTDKDTVVVHDNATAGGYPLLREDLSNLPAGTIVDADINASAGIVDTKLATIATAGKVSNSATTATNANTASAIVARDASGNFSAGTITANLTGTASAIANNTVTSAKIVDGAIVNADVNNSAAIAGTKINPDFGSQNVVTTGASTAARFIPTSSTVPTNGVYLPGANEVGVATNTSESARIDSSGRLLVGTSTAIPGANTTNTLQIHGTDGAASWQATRWSNNAAGPLNTVQKSRGGAVGTRGAVLNGDILGRIGFAGDDGTNFVEGARIAVEVDGTPGANDMPGRLVFSTTPSGSSSPTEGMRIDSSQRVWVSDAFSFSANFVTLSRLKAYTSSGSNTGGVAIECATNSTSTRHHISFVNPNGVVGSISTNASATTYATSSDYRLKENVVPLTGAIDRLQQIPVHRFNFIADPDTVVDGFIAHEAQEIVPECVTGTKDEVDEDGNPVYQGIDQSKLVPLLTAALQEAIAEIASLKDRVAALEA